MEFHSAQPIFMQIVDHVSDMILRGELSQDQQVPSVRELAVTLEVNPNTVMRAFERLTMADIVYNKRGLGYFVKEGALEKVQEMRRTRLFSENLPMLADEMRLLNISSKEIAAELKNLLDKKKNEK